MATVYVMEAVNLFAGDGNPNASNHLTLTELKLPAMEENYLDHLAGGAPMAMEVNTHLNRPECTFNLAGITPHVQALMGSWSKPNQRFTAYGGIRDRNTGKLFKATAKIWGRLGRVNPTAFQRGQLMQHEHSIRSIVHYELIYAGRQMWYWDFFTNQLIIAGNDLNAEMNGLLSIPGGSGGEAEIGGAGNIPTASAAGAGAFLAA